MAENLSDRLVKALPAPAAGNRIVYDTRVPGFGIRITKAGSRAFVLNYRTKAAGRERRWTIGQYPAWSVGSARDEARRLKRSIDGGADPVAAHRTERGAPTVDAALDRFAVEYLPRRRPSTAKSYAQLIERNVRPQLGRSRVSAVTFHDIHELHRAISRRAPGAANRAVAVISRVFSLCIRWGWRTDNPCKGVERNQENKRRRYLTADELVRLSAALASHRDQQAAAIVRLLLLTGSRRGEALTARWADVDLAAGVWTKPASTTKQKLVHTIPLSGAALMVLTELSDRAESGVEWVFPGKGTGHRKNVAKSWAAICAATSIDGVRVHDLRHTYASVLASSGLGLPVIGALLGHATPVTTHRYSHLFDDPLRQATERAAAVISGKPAAKVPLKSVG